MRATLAVFFFLPALVLASIFPSTQLDRRGDESPIPGLSVCAFTCTADAATQYGCVSYLNVSCVCTNTEFQAAAGTCMLTKCTNVEVQTAMVYQKTVCPNPPVVTSLTDGSASASSKGINPSQTVDSNPTSAPGGSAASLHVAWAASSLVILSAALGLSL
ncbi:hypothetical protein BKA62DRAFT_425912 [Auriculariales sp. MPI-PUGE-AT-0066]|nr:hypothetical protein BKA62DRAFT_425912 [Auriculariales sp. MPI-PUGE-AT-0066]